MIKVKVSVSKKDEDFGVQKEILISDKINLENHTDPVLREVFDVILRHVCYEYSKFCEKK